MPATEDMWGLDASRTLQGDMTDLFYAKVGECQSLAAERTAAAFLFEGLIPEVPLTIDHYRAAVAWHKSGKIGDAELTALALILRLADGAPSVKRANVLQPFGPQAVRRTLEFIGVHSDTPGLPPLLELLTRHRLRGIKDMARLALLAWGVGRYPGCLAIGIVTPLELLLAQARGERQVGIGLPLGDFRDVDAGYPGGFTHHDLCHLAKFRGDLLDDAKVYQGQVGFFRALAELLAREPHLLDEWTVNSQPNVPPQATNGMDMTVVFADTNGDVRLLLTLFFARLLARGGVSKGGATAAFVSTYLWRLGMPPGDAAQAGGLWESQRAEFLQVVGDWFEVQGAACQA